MGTSSTGWVDGEESAWVRAHRALSRRAALKARSDVEEGRELLAALRTAAHMHAGFGSFVEYIGQLLGHGPRLTHEKLRVAEALEELPLLTQALESGTLNWSAVRELTRVVTPDTEAAWLDVARGTPARLIEPLVAGAVPGDAPDDPRHPDARRHVLRFEVAADTFALFREAVAQLRRTSITRLDDDAALLAMARAVLGGPRDEGRSSYQIALSVCESCGRGAQTAGGERVSVGEEIVAMARCDAQQLGHVATNDAVKAESAVNDIAHENATLVAIQNEGPNQSQAHDASGRPEAEVAPPNEAHRVGTQSHVGARAKQTIPPSLRRQVLHRDQHRCCVPGCKNTHFLDLHHIKLRTEGGANTAANILTLCGVHHRAAHRGELLIDKTSSGAPRFRHADGSPYGRLSDPRALDAYGKVFSALRNLGFSEREAREALEELRQRDDEPAPSTEQLLRQALEQLGPSGPAG